MILTWLSPLEPYIFLSQYLEVFSLRAQALLNTEKPVIQSVIQLVIRWNQQNDSIFISQGKEIKNDL